MLLVFISYLDQMDSDRGPLFGRQLRSRTDHLLEWGWIAVRCYYTLMDVEVSDYHTTVVEVTVHEDEGIYTYQDPMNSKNRHTGPIHEVASYNLQHDVFLDHVADQLGIEPRFASRRRVVVENHLWYLGDLRVGRSHVFAPVFWGRSLHKADLKSIQTALSDAAFGTSGVVLSYSELDLDLPNDHQLRTFEELMYREDGKEQFDHVMLERILVGLPRSSADEPEEWFDNKTGRLKLSHLEAPVMFEGIQASIITLFWKERHGAELSWAEVRRRTSTASKGINDAFRGRDWQQWIERIGHGKLRLRTLPPK